MEASGAINANVNVAMDSFSNITIKAAGSDDAVIGYALEAATAAGQLIRVKIKIA
jgi:predicted RecA/RadA family phage recombinase